MLGIEEYEKLAKFPKGETMTVDEVSEVVGPEFKEMNENPPESVVNLREEMGRNASTALDGNWFGFSDDKSNKAVEAVRNRVLRFRMRFSEGDVAKSLSTFSKEEVGEAIDFLLYNGEIVQLEEGFRKLASKKVVSKSDLPASIQNALNKMGSVSEKIAVYVTSKPTFAESNARYASVDVSNGRYRISSEDFGNGNVIVSGYETDGSAKVALFLHPSDTTILENI